jgi:septum site-determining protein MinC
MSKNRSFRLVGSKGALRLIIEQRSSLSDIINYVSVFFESNKRFFEGTKVVFEIQTLCDLETSFVEQLKLKLARFVEIESFKFEDLDLNDKGIKSVEDIDNKMCFDKMPTKYIYKSLRSGQKVESKGNVIILGDVNPGSKISAGGSVIVLGSLKGVVQAGILDSSSIVFALNFDPVQVQIGGFFELSTEDGKDLNDNVVAYYKDNKINTESWKGRKFLIGE